MTLRLDMSDTEFASPEQPRAPDGECVTILSPDSAGATAEFKRLGLCEQGFVIAGQVVRHRFAFAGGAAPAPFDGEPLFAATYVRAPARRGELA